MALPQDVRSPVLKLECAVFGPENAIAAQHAGVQRVELNARGSYQAGGITPDPEEFRACKPTVEVPIRVMIRPRGPPHRCGELDFIYKPEEKQKMRDSIKAFKDLNLMNPVTGDGFVFGALALAGDADLSEDPTAGYEVDQAFCEELIQLAAPFPCVFHRAFDQIVCSSPSHTKRQLGVLASCGFRGILTSGGLGGSYHQHFEKLDALREMMSQDSNLNKLQLIVGGGLRKWNANMAMQHLGANNKSDEVWLHSAAVKKVSGSAELPKAGEMAQNAKEEAKLALLAKDRYQDSEVQGIEHVNHDVDTHELKELLSTLASERPS